MNYQVYYKHLKDLILKQVLANEKVKQLEILHDSISIKNDFNIFTQLYIYCQYVIKNNLN